MRKTLKKKIKLLIECLPYGHDIFLSVFRNRLPISYRGVFQSFEQASTSIPIAKQDYDNTNRKKKEDLVQTGKTIDSGFRDHDYPLLFWLSKLQPVTTGILELGGSIGHFYYSSKRFAGIDEKTKWQIAELPEAVSLGRELALERNEQQLSFIDSNQITNSDPANVFISSGAIQYMTVSLTDTLRSLPVLPDHVITHDIPVHSKQEFWTTQRLEHCEIPYHVYFSDKFIEDLSELGFELIAQWDWARPMEIPFHKDYGLDFLRGFYFRRKHLSR